VWQIINLKLKSIKNISDRSNCAPDLKAALARLALNLGCTMVKLDHGLVLQLEPFNLINPSY